MLQCLLVSALSHIALSQEVAPLGATCFVSAKPSDSLPMEDLALLKERWRSKEVIEFKSGNAGIYLSGTYFIISKDLPVLKGLHNRYMLAMKVIKLACANGRAKICQIAISPSELEHLEKETLIRQMWVGYGISYQVEDLAGLKALKFDFSGQTNFTSESGQSVAISESYNSTAEIESQLNANGVPVPLLPELSERHRKEAFEILLKTSAAGNPAPESEMFFRVLDQGGFNANYASMNKSALDVVEKLFVEKRQKYKAEIAAASAPLRALQPYLFKRFGETNVQENDPSIKKRLVEELLKYGAGTREEASKKADSMRSTGMEIVINMHAETQAWGHKPDNYVSIARIWP